MPTLTAYLGWSSPRERGRLARILIPANSLPSTATPSQSAPNPPLRGSLRLCQALCGRDARAPGGAPFDRLHCLHRLIREGCQRNERCEKSLQRTSSAMEADGLFVHQQRSDASLIPGIHTNGKLCFWNESPTLTAYLGWSSPRERGRPARILIPASASRPRPLPRKTHQTRLYGVLFACARLCAGETPAFPGGFLARVWPYAMLMAVTTIKSTYLLDVESVRALEELARHLGGAEVRSVAAGPCFCNELPTLTAYLCRSSPRERGRLARILIPASSLPSTATPSQSAPNPPLRGSLPSCQALCGRDARVPGGSCAGGTPALPGAALYPQVQPGRSLS